MPNRTHAHAADRRPHCRAKARDPHRRADHNGHAGRPSRRRARVGPSAPLGSIRGRAQSATICHRALRRPGLSQRHPRPDRAPRTRRASDAGARLGRGRRHGHRSTPRARRSIASRRSTRGRRRRCRNPGGSPVGPTCRPSSMSRADFLIPSDNGLRLLALRAVEDNVFSVASIAIPDRKVRRIGEMPATDVGPHVRRRQLVPRQSRAAVDARHARGWTGGTLAGDAAPRADRRHQPDARLPRGRVNRRAPRRGRRQDDAGRPALWPPRLGRILHASGSSSRRASPCCPTRGCSGPRGRRGRTEPDVEAGEGDTLTVVAHKHDVEAPVAVVRLGGRDPVLDHTSITAHSWSSTIVGEWKSSISIRETRQSFRATI